MPAVRLFKALCGRYCQSFTSLATYAAPLLIIIAWLVTIIVEPTPITLATQHYPPYQIVDWNNKSMSGETVDAVTCTLGRLGVKYNIVPYRKWGEAQEDVRNGKVDGLLGALHTVERDMYATWSDPAGFHFMQYIATHEGNHDNLVDYRDITARFAVKEAAGTASQIAFANNHTITFVGPTNKSIIQALLDKKADFIYMDYKVFDYESKELGLTNLHSNFEFYPGASQGYGIYWSNKYLKLHPGFLDKFNDQLKTCVTPL